MHSDQQVFWLLKTTLGSADKTESSQISHFNSMAYWIVHGVAWDSCCIAITLTCWHSGGQSGLGGGDDDWQKVWQIFHSYVKLYCSASHGREPPVLAHPPWTFCSSWFVSCTTALPTCDQSNFCFSKYLLQFSNLTPCSCTTLLSMTIPSNSVPRRWAQWFKEAVCAIDTRNKLTTITATNYRPTFIGTSGQPWSPKGLRKENLSRLLNQKVSKGQMSFMLSNQHYQHNER